MVFVYASNSAFADGKPADHQFLNLSIEELMNIKVTTVSRRPQRLNQVASAVFVITQDDIRRSGATNIPDALRMAPGVQVERIGTNKWAVSIRGFDGRFSNKLQVLMDGRSVYSSLFSGTFWEQQDTMMEDIERIEVIRGPAATVWGVNAVNGVINIITKKASDTQGTLFTAGGGSFEHGFVGARYGGQFNDYTPFRIYAKGFSRDHTFSTFDTNNHDRWHSARGGFRVDHNRGIDQYTLQGDFFANSIGDTINKSQLDLPGIVSGHRGFEEGGNIRFRWDRTLSDRSSIMFQTYYDHVRHKILPIVDYRAQSFDLDFQHRFPLLDRHDLTWGANYRLYYSKFQDTAIIELDPRARTNHVYSGFIRDDITLIPEQLVFTLGTRLDHNDFTGLEVQPNARLMWTPDNENSIWMAVSRAVRTPSRAENDIHINALQLREIPGVPLQLPFPILVAFQGSHHFDSEKLIAYELGYRHQFTPQASVDIAGFVNDYSQLRDASFGALSFSTGLPKQIVLPTIVNNQASALTYGFEISTDWKPIDKWRLQGNYSFLEMQINSNPLTKQLDATSSGADKANPQHQVSIRSNYDISDKLETNLWLRYISHLAYFDIPGYVTMDAKLTYKPARNIELFIVGQNLFSQHHQERVADLIPSMPVLVPRGVYAGVQWRF